MHLAEKVTAEYLRRIVSDARGSFTQSPANPRGGRVRVAAYKAKKTIRTKDGEERVVYEYGPRQIQRRHQEKAERLERLRGMISDLREQARKDLKAKDPKTKATALGVLLMDETYERVGNEESAADGHFGVSGWEVRHVRFKDGEATISYVGKSGVSHTKTVRDATLVKALKEAVKGKSKGDCVVDVEAPDINEYLKKFDITSKDIRGYHANELMKAELRKIRRDGPDLPRARKEKDKILKDEFNQALEAVAEEVGHEPNTLRNQYLVPSLKEGYLHDGSVVKALDGDD